MNHPDEGDGLNDLRTRIALYLTRGDPDHCVGKIDTNSTFEGNFLISTREIEDALNVFEQVLNIRGSNIPALIGMVLITSSDRSLLVNGSPIGKDLLCPKAVSRGIETIPTGPCTEARLQA